LRNRWGLGKNVASQGIPAYEKAMHNFKSFFVISAVAACATVQPLHATDTPEQAAMREAMRKAMSGSSGVQAAPVSQPIVSAPASQPSKPVPAPVAAQPAESQYRPLPAASGSSEALQAALRRQMSGAPQEQPAATSSSGGEYSAVPPASSGSSGLQAVLRQQPTPAEPAAAVAAPVAETKPAESSAAPPAAPAAQTKEDKLASLLMLYKANTITPEQYHKERAAILAGN
jgi:hypothetical protein